MVRVLSGQVRHHHVPCQVGQCLYFFLFENKFVLSGIFMIGFVSPPLNPTKVDLWTLKKLLCETVNQLKLELILSKVK